MPKYSNDMLYHHFEKLIGQEVMVKKDIRVPKVNVRTAKDNKPKNDKVIQSEYKVKVLEVGTSNGFSTHGNPIAKITDGSLTYWVNLDDLYGYIHVLSYKFLLSDEGKCTVVYGETDKIVDEFITQHSIESDEFLNECEQKAFEMRKLRETTPNSHF